MAVKWSVDGPRHLSVNNRGASNWHDGGHLWNEGPAVDNAPRRDDIGDFGNAVDAGNNVVANRVQGRTNKVIAANKAAAERKKQNDIAFWGDVSDLFVAAGSASWANQPNGIPIDDQGNLGMDFKFGGQDGYVEQGILDNFNGRMKSYGREKTNVRGVKYDKNSNGFVISGTDSNGKGFEKFYSVRAVYSMVVKNYMASGMSEDAANRAAAKAFGDVNGYVESADRNWKRHQEEKEEDRKYAEERYEKERADRKADAAEIKKEEREYEDKKYKERRDETREYKEAQYEKRRKEELTDRDENRNYVEKKQSVAEEKEGRKNAETEFDVIWKAKVVNFATYSDDVDKYRNTEEGNRNLQYLDWLEKTIRDDRTSAAKRKKYIRQYYKIYQDITSDLVKARETKSGGSPLARANTLQ